MANELETLKQLETLLAKLLVISQQLSKLEETVANKTQPKKKRTEPLAVLTNDRLGFCSKLDPDVFDPTTDYVHESFLDYKDGLISKAEFLHQITPTVLLDIQHWNNPPYTFDLDAILAQVMTQIEADLPSVTPALGFRYDIYLSLTVRKVSRAAIDRKKGQ